MLPNFTDCKWNSQSFNVYTNILLRDFSFSFILLLYGFLFVCLFGQVSNGHNVRQFCDLIQMCKFAIQNKYIRILLCLGCLICFILLLLLLLLLLFLLSFDKCIAQNYIMCQLVSHQLPFKVYNRRKKELPLLGNLMHKQIHMHTVLHKCFIRCSFLICI